MRNAKQAPRSVARRRRWAARLALAALGALLALLIAAGALRSITALLVGLGALAIVSAAAWSFAAHRGVRRVIAAIVLLAAPIAVIVVYITAGLLVEIAVCVALAVIAVAAARAAGPAPQHPEPPQRPAAPARHPFLIMNPRSGGGKVERFQLRERAVARGAEVVLLDGPGEPDAARLARDACERGADLLGVAGGDGTQALVAQVAAEHGVPLLVVTAGTRNHFAMDLGLDRQDPARCLDALGDGVELRVDLGIIGGRPFVNNASFGAYAEIVRSPAYREDKAATALRMLPDLIGGRAGPRLEVHIDGRCVLSGPQAVLVSNNPYEAGDIAGLARRERIDTGLLGVVAVGVSSLAQAAALLTPRGQRGAIARYTGREVVIDADAPSLAVGVDGESLLMPTPVRCSIRPGALRVLVPRDRPGVPAPHGPADWVATGREAIGLPRRR